MLYSASETMYWVVKDQFNPHYNRDGWADYELMTGSVLFTSGNLYNKTDVPGIYSPMAVTTPEGKLLNMSATFPFGKPQFLGRVWGPYDGEQVKNLWFFRGEVGPDKRDFTLYRAGSLHVARLDDIARRSAICSANFAAIMGNALLKRSASGSFSIAEEFNLASIIQEDKAA